MEKWEYRGISGDGKQIKGDALSKVGCFSKAKQQGAVMITIIDDAGAQATFTRNMGVWEQIR